MNIKTAFAATLAVPRKESDLGYFELMKTCLKSILKHNPGFGLTFFIFHDKTVTKEMRKELDGIYWNIEFVEVNVEKYHKNKKFKCTFYSIESFYPRGYDRIIFIGADCLCMNSIEPMLKVNVPIGMPREKRRPEIFSNGIMIIGKENITKNRYNDLLETNYDHIKHFGTDMKLYNLFFKGQITEVEYRFDVVDTECPEFIDLQDVIFLHFINKPKSPQLRPFYQALWDKYRAIK